MTRTIQTTLFTLLILSIAVPTTGMAFAAEQNVTATDSITIKDSVKVTKNVNATDTVMIKDSAKVTKNSSMMSLKAQLEKTTNVDDLSCAQSNHVLILKQSTNTPACVKFTSQEKLLDRGWGIFISA